MYLPTDYQLQINVVYYDVNSARIFFTDGFWKPYSDQLIKDYRRETGLVLNDRKKFLAKIKRALFNYFYLKLICQKKTSDLYSTVISIFHEFSQNSLPRKVTSIDDVPVFYDDDWKLEDPTDAPLETQDAETSKTVGSMSDILLAHESVSRREYDINKEHEDLSDQFLQQYLNEKTNLERFQFDYQQGTLQHLFFDIGQVKMKLDVTNIFKLTERLYNHYQGSIGMLTIFNAISLKEVELSTEIKSERRFDLWMKTYQQYGVFRSLVNYIGSDVCTMLYNHFLKHVEFKYWNGYHYVFNSFILHDFIKRSYFRSPGIKHSKIIDLDSDLNSLNQSRIFNSFRNNKTGQFMSIDKDTGFGTTTQKSSAIFQGKGLTNTDYAAKPFSSKSLGFGSRNSSTSGFSFVSKDDQDSD